MTIAQARAKHAGGRRSSAGAARMRLVWSGLVAGGALVAGCALLARPVAGQVGEWIDDDPDAFHLLTYNVFMRAPLFVFRDAHDERVALLDDQLDGYDAIVLQEAFSDRHRERLVAELADRYPHRTRVLGRDGLIRQDGGVVILSRWPIGHEDQRLFGDACAGTDCLAQKGVVYARIHKAGRRYHLFGLHAQADRSHAAVRERQLQIVQAFVADQRIPPDEPVVIGGDVNVDLLTDDQSAEYTRMMEILDATHPPLVRGPDELSTWDAASNSMLDAPARKHVDYILYSRAHLRPVWSVNEVRFVRQGDQDLSDHHAVYGGFRFPRPPAVRTAEPEPEP
jgi:endonuclease/exonuclease/phosphatase family metal-dependent hydrolase